eukprot:445380_1
MMLTILIYLLSTNIVCGYIKTCNITDYGAKGDNKTINTKFIQSAIDDCGKASNDSKHEKSLVILPSLYHNDGETIYISGALFLKSNLAFYIEKDVRLLATSDKSNKSWPYIYTRRAGTMMLTHSSLLNGGLCVNLTNYNTSRIGDQCSKWNKLKNIKIFGYGKMDGNGNSGWYNQSNNKQISSCSGDLCKVRPCLVNLMWIDDLVIFNITLENPPFWTLHILFCNNILIDNISIFTDSPNGDGIDPDSCSNVLIQNSYITTGDDQISVKSGKNADGRAVGISSNNITIVNMIMGKGDGLTIGSEMSGNVTNVLFENIVMNGTTNGVRVKSKVGRGGMVANVTYKNIVMTNVSTGIIISEYYQPKVNASGNAIPIFKNIYIENISGQVDKCGQLECLPEMPCENIVINNVNFTGYTKEYECQYIHGEEEGCTPKPCINTTNSLGISKLK